MTEKTIFGLNLSNERYDEIFMQHVKKEWQAYEGSLYRSKWFDYRFVNPVMATYIYCHHYEVIYRRIYRKTIDLRISEHIKVLKHEDLFSCSSSFISGMWRGRQHADAMGMPYQVYIEMAFNDRLRFWRRAYLPQPQMLYSGDLTRNVGEEWEKHQSGILYTGKHAAYKNENYHDLPAQNDHHEWLLAQADKRANGVDILQQFLDAGLIPIEKIQARFGNEVTSRLPH